MVILGMVHIGLSTSANGSRRLGTVSKTTWETKCGCTGCSSLAPAGLPVSQGLAKEDWPKTLAMWGTQFFCVSLG